MIIGTANAFNSTGGNHKTQMMVEATDLDIKCAWMTFIQCNLYGIPAIVTHGNSLTLETYETFYTFPFLSQDWENKKTNILELNFSNYNELEELLSIF